MRGTRTSFVGRHTEIDAITRMLDTERCITVTGVGGCGKTRLALEIAHRRAEGFADGIAVAELAPLADADDVARVVADAVGMPVVGASVTRDLSVFLRDRQLLLVLDNCEHLLDACGDLVEELVETCPGVTMLVTSREPLGVDGERAWRAPSLSLPAHDDHDPFAAEAAALFVARAESAQPGFVAADHRQAIISICRGLDGLPLALELAAARTSHLTPEQIAEMLDDRFRLLTGGARRARQRQQTLQAAMDWSHDLLTEDERRLLRRLSVFAGGWTLDAAVDVAGDGDRVATVDGLGSLVAKSLVVADETEAGMRYRMLETVRLYAQDRLVEAGEAEALRDRQRDWLFRSLGEIRASGGRWVSVISTRAEDELDNLRIALDWSAEQGRGDLATRLIVLTWPMWYVARLSSEARVWLDRFPPDDGALSTAEQVELQIARGFLLQEEMDGSGIVAAGESALALDPTGIASDATGLAWFLRLMVPTFLDPPAAVRIAREALAWLRDYASDGDVADMVTGYCSQSFISDGQWEEARMLAEPLATRDDVLEILRVYAGASVATISLLHGDAEAARERARAIVAGMPARPGRHGDTWAHALLAIAEAACGDAGTSRRALQDTVSVVRRRYAHIPTSWGIPITAAGVILAVEGRDHEAMRLFVAAGAQGRLWHFRQETTFVLHREYSRLVAERLGPEATHQAWSEGEAMTVEAMQDAVDALATEA